jgi:hypothetical protein
MPTAQALNRKLHSTVAPAATAENQPSKSADVTEEKENKLVRLHITPFNPVLLKAYLAPSVLPLAQNISYHSVETFPEKGFGYLELPTMEAAKLKKKLNGSILKGSKIRIEDAKPEKRKALVNGESAEEEKDERPSKRAKKQKEKQGVLEGVELPDGRKVKRGWTEPPTKHKKDKADKKDKKDKKEKKARQKESKYTKEPELLFKAHLTPAAANALEASSKDKKKKDKKDKKSKSKREVVVHEFENNTKHASFLKTPKISHEKKPAVEYVNGKGWVDEDGTVVEPETGKARNRRLLELVDTAPIVDTAMSDTAPAPTTEKKPSATPEAEPSKSKVKSKGAEKSKKKKATPPPSSSSESSEDESSVVSSSESSDESDSESNASSTRSNALTAPQTIVTPSSPEEKKEVHPLEVLFKRPNESASTATSTPSRLAPIKTSFSFFGEGNAEGDPEDGNPPVTPFTKQDLEFRGLRSAAPTPDTAAIGRRFSFPWRTGSHEEEEGDDDIEADKELNLNTKANAVPATINEEDEDVESDKDVDAMDEDEVSDVDANSTPLAARAGKSTAKEGKEGAEKEETEFEKWFWENRGDNNRAWKKRKREGLKMQRLRENRKITSTRRI